jgi:hypothetical protein
MSAPRAAGRALARRRSALAGVLLTSSPAFLWRCRVRDRGEERRIVVGEHAHDRKIECTVVRG